MNKAKILFSNAVDILVRQRISKTKTMGINKFFKYIAGRKLQKKADPLAVGWGMWCQTI